MGAKFRKSRIGLVAGGVVLATVAGAIASFAVTGPNGMSTLTASGTVTAGAAADVGKMASNPATQTVTSGATSTWVDSFQNTGALVSTGQIAKRWDPATQVYVPGSFSTPDGWSRTYTTNGTDWTDTEPAAARVQGVRADAALVPAAGRPGVAGPVTSPTAASISSSISGGGDTYFPFF